MPSGVSRRIPWSVGIIGVSLSRQRSRRLRGAGVHRLKLQGEIDIANCDLVLADFLVEIDSDGTAPTIEVDCSASSSSIRADLNMLTRLAQRTGKKLVLIALPDKCRRTFEVTKLDHVFEFRDT